VVCGFQTYPVNDIRSVADRAAGSEVEEDEAQWTGARAATER